MKLNILFGAILITVRELVFGLNEEDQLLRSKSKGNEKPPYHSWSATNYSPLLLKALPVKTEIQLKNSIVCSITRSLSLSTVIMW